MKFEVQSVEDVQPEGTNNYFVVVGGDTGAPWEQKGFATREAAESCKELMERVFLAYQEKQAALEAVVEVAKGEHGCTYDKSSCNICQALFNLTELRKQPTASQPKGES